ncbi:MAG: hypothetical protein QF926_06240 [Alphaproteobacteria bacterium]|jgi:hypothetical protein|nr:hypothetical protein [Alphaproteobacteria bacterium]MDP6516205.1 hypothetical protein [Alphaproteobacteria bacterium]|tara:strand:+ start:126 stop:287 length:162 start_codon:yes stop_codon:yes gene_type:complete
MVKLFEAGHFTTSGASWASRWYWSQAPDLATIEGDAPESIERHQSIQPKESDS